MAHTLIGVVTSEKRDKTITVSIVNRETHPLYRKQYTKTRKYTAHDENNDANINEINAIILKNRLVQCKQQMRQWGYEPLIRINYKKLENKKES